MNHHARNQGMTYIAVILYDPHVYESSCTKIRHDTSSKLFAKGDVSNLRIVVIVISVYREGNIVTTNEFLRLILIDHPFRKEASPPVFRELKRYLNKPINIDMHIIG